MPPDAAFWPTPSDYQNALLNAGVTCRDPELQSAKLVRNERGRVITCGGNNAVVFKMTSGDDQVPPRLLAVKCFLNPTDLLSRYEALSKHIENHKIRHVVKFKYRDEEILIKGTRYPLVKMRWVEGKTLREIVEEYQHNAGALRIISDFWMDMARGHADAQFTHCDIHPRNVLWVPTDKEHSYRPTLIDLDGCWVPELADRPTRELGLPEFQHPDRTQERVVYSPAVDRFSHLVVYTALRSIAADRENLWDRYDSKENLLFTKEDFEACRENGEPREPSKLLRQLWGQSTDEVKWLAGRVTLAAAGSLEEVPQLHDIFSGGRVKRLQDVEIDAVSRILHLEPEKYWTNELGMEFAWVPPGKSWFGGGGGEPGTEEFELPKGLYCGIYPVTQEQWKAVMGDEPSYFKGTPNYPVESVSWDRVQEFLTELNKKFATDGLLYRLPTEQEWEYVCRGGSISQEQSKYRFYFVKSKTDRTPVPTNNLLTTQANFKITLGHTSEAGKYPPNPLGIYDLHGNVWEWTSSEYGSNRVIRGGSWNSFAEGCRAAHRTGRAASHSSNNVGLRLARVPSDRQ